MALKNNLPTFTRTLTAFCLVLFIFLFLPDSLSNLSIYLKYLLLAGIIGLLLMYNEVLGSLSISPDQEIGVKPTEPENVIGSDSKTTGALYENLNLLVLSTVKALNPKYESAVYMIDPESQVFSLQISNSDSFLNSIQVSNAMIGTLLKGTSVVYQKDNGEAWNDLFESKTWRGSECVIGSPISLHGITAGFVLTKIGHFSDLTDSDKSVLTSLGKYISYGLENLETLEKHIIGEDNKARILDLLANLNIKSDETRILDQFKYLIRTVFHYDRLTVSLQIENDSNAIIKLVDGVEDEFLKNSEFPVNGSLHGIPIVNGETIISQNWHESHPNFSRFSSSEPESDIKSVLGVPILIAGESKGSLFMERLTGRPYTDSDQKTLDLLGRVLGSSLYWLIEYEKIYQNATHDGLSKLLNHQTYKDRFAEEIQRAKRFQHHMAVLIFDLDKFKRINDTLGHPYGDYVIQTVAKIMSKNVRTVDVVARYGGEEFAIILINTTAKMAMVVAQRIVNNIADYPFSMDGSEVTMTISGGMAEYPTHSEDMKELIKLSDQAMYDAKQKGGNGILIHGYEENATIVGD